MDEDDRRGEVGERLGIEGDDAETLLETAKERVEDAERSAGGAKEHDERGRPGSAAQVHGESTVGHRHRRFLQRKGNALAKLHEHAPGLLRMEEEDAFAVGARAGGVRERMESGLPEPRHRRGDVVHLEGEVMDPFSAPVEKFRHGRFLVERYEELELGRSRIDEVRLHAFARHRFHLVRSDAEQPLEERRRLRRLPHGDADVFESDHGWMLSSLEKSGYGMIRRGGSPGKDRMSGIPRRGMTGIPGESRVLPGVCSARRRQRMGTRLRESR